MIQSLDSFTVSVDYGRKHTTFHVCVDGQHAPVVQMRKRGVYDSRYRYSVYAGPQLDELVGFVSNVGTEASDGQVKLGRVDHRSGGLLGKDQWTFAQTDLPVLTGMPKGFSGKLRDSRARSLAECLSPSIIPAIASSVFDVSTSRCLLFSAQESTGFELIRRAGLRSRYAVKIHDDRINRLLVLACVVHYDTFCTRDPRQAIADWTSNPLRD